MRLQLDPNYAYAWHGVSVFGSFVWRRLDEALAAIEQARRLEPLSAPIACDVGFTLVRKRPVRRGHPGMPCRHGPAPVVLPHVCLPGTCPCSSRPVRGVR